MRYWSAFLIAIIVVAGSIPVHAQNVHRTSVTVGGRVVPLPPGDWTEIGRSSDLRTLRGGGQTYTIEALLLAQREAGRITAFVNVWQASSNPTFIINWDIPRFCSREDIFANLTRQALPQAQDCLALNHDIINPGVPPTNPLEHWRGFWRLASEQPQAVPRTTLLNSFSLAEAGNLLRVTYMFSPEYFGFPRESTTSAWASSAWHRSNLNDQRRDTLERMKRWAEQARPIVLTAFRWGSAAPLPALPRPEALRPAPDPRMAPNAGMRWE